MSPFLTTLIVVSSETIFISNILVIFVVFVSCACTLIFKVIFLFWSLNVTDDWAGVSLNSLPSPICILACSSVAITSIRASCVSFPLSYTVAIYFPSCSSICFPSTFTLFIELSVDFLIMFTWYITFSPFSAVTITSNLVSSLAIVIVFANVCNWLSPSISTIATSLLAFTNTVASVSCLSIYFV